MGDAFTTGKGNGHKTTTLSSSKGKDLVQETREKGFMDLVNRHSPRNFLGAILLFVVVVATNPDSLPYFFQKDSFTNS